MNTLVMEWRYTYRSARRDGFRRSTSLRKFAREVAAGWRLTLGLYPRYDRHGHDR
jgi:hypothetical protein